MDSMQNYYGQAIGGNKGNIDGIKEGIKAIQYHMIRQDNLSLEKQHQFCPKGTESWCKFWLDKLDNTNIYDDKKRLPDVFRDELNPIFERLSSN